MVHGKINSVYYLEFYSKFDLADLAKFGQRIRRNKNKL